MKANLTLIFVLLAYAFYSKQVSISTTSTEALICKWAVITSYLQIRTWTEVAKIKARLK